MYKVFLVEDEPPILEMIKGMINNGNYGFEVIGTSYNGRDALKLLPENLPDVLITDIKMPFLDGLALINEVNNVLPEIKTIILSGYSDFEYARTALRLRVIDYILKPVHPDGLTSVFKRLRDLLDQEKLKQEHACLNSLINGNDMEERSMNHFPPLDYYPILICAGTLSNQVYDIMCPGQEFWLKDGLKRVNEWGNALPVKKFWLLNGVFPNEKILFLAVDAQDNNPIIARCRELISVLANDMLTINLIIGSPVKQINQSRLALKEIRSILKHEIVFGQSGLFTDNSHSDQTPPVSPEQEKRFSVLAQQTELASFQKCLKVMFDEWQQLGVTQLHLEQLLDGLNDTLKRYFVLKTDKQVKVMISEVLTNSMSYNELFHNCCEIFKYYFDGQVEKQAIKTAKELVDQIEKYLIDHYNENFTYKTFYNLFGYNETYITNVFRNIKGISPSKFVTKLRIEKAKEIMMAQPEILLRTVAEMVGYEDPLYFSRVFKEFTGINPSEYIKRNL